MARKQSIQYEIKTGALDGITDDDTIKGYKTNIDKFKAYAETAGISPAEIRSDVVGAIQSWERYLEERNYTPNTIHTYLAPVCKGLGICMDKIDKPKRDTRSMTKGRSEMANLQGKSEKTKEKYERLVSFQSVVGIRRDELADLRKKDIVRTVDGDLYVHVIRGKGGKEQYQYVLPQDRAIVEKTIQDLGDRERIFKPEEMKNHIDLHSIRAEQAQKAYAYYHDRLQKEPAYKVECIRRMTEYFKTMNNHDDKFERRFRDFKTDIKTGNFVYRVRGDNAQKARELGKPVAYDRVALMMVSVFHLAHWRTDVTVKNYMLR